MKWSLPDARKKYFESPWIPIVPGPTISARTLISEKAPPNMPNPRPDTENQENKSCSQLLYHIYIVFIP